MDAKRIQWARAAVFLLMLCVSAPAGAADALVAASSDEHAWFIAEHELGGCEVRHIAADADGPYYERGLSLPRAPLALAAWDNQLWLAFQEQDRLDVFTVDVVRNAAFGGWYHEPADRLRPVPAIEPSGTLAGFVGSSQGPVALIHDAGSGARLVQLRGDRWQPLPLPDGLDPDATLRLAAGGAEGQVLLVLEAPSGTARCVVHRRDPQGAWSAHESRFSLDELRGSCRVGSAIALLLEGPRPGACRIEYLRTTGLLPLVGFTVPAAQRCALIGFRSGLVLIDEDRGGGSWSRRIDALAAESGPRERLSPRPLITGRMLHWPVLAAALIAGLMVVLLLGPRPGGGVTLPAEMVPLSAAGRMAALMVDGAIAGTAVILLLRCAPSELLRSPLLSSDLGRSIPFLLTAGLTVALGTAGELMTGRTPGKALLGARVVAANGASPSVAAILVRNLFKAIVLLVPVLAIIALLSPNAQGLGDLIARTVVVRRADAAPKDR